LIMWPTTVMEILFAGGMLSLVADMGGRFSSQLKRYGAGAVSALAVAFSLGVLASDWTKSLGPVVSLQPTTEPFATLYVADKFTTFTAFTVLVVGLAVLLYSVMYFDSGRQGPFYALFSILMCSLVGVVSAGDLLTLFLFWEGMTVSAYGLVTFGRSQLTMEAGVKYFLMAGVGSLLALYGIAGVYFTAGSIQLSVVGAALGSGFGQLGLLVLLLGLGVEAAVVPLHTWLPDVYSASSLPTASVISGAVTGVGVFALLKVLEPLVPGNGYAAVVALGSTSNLQLVLVVLALITMLVGNLSALTQGNLRRILSFSSIAQTGYMLAALSTLNLVGVVAVVFTIWNHGLLKSNFFMVLGKKNASIEESQLDRLRGVGRGNRFLGFLYASSSMAMMGAPPFGMFWSEILVVQSLLLAGQTSGVVFYGLAAAVVLNIVLSIGYYYRIINTVVFGEEQGEKDERPVSNLLPSASLLAISVLTGIAPFLILGNVL
jgi:formate hydrogenlyase subunit 3/multisubunit Na+/H+ antiporter MnhD subunit